MPKKGLGRLNGKILTVLSLFIKVIKKNYFQPGLKFLAKAKKEI
jgi:hypothetical protein